MTCSKSYGRLLQASCLGLIGALAIAGCGSSDSNPPNKGNDGGPDGPAPSAVLHINKGTADFGTVAVGSASAAVEFIVDNTGTGTSSPIAAAVTGPGFAVTPASCTALAPKAATCVLKVTFTPAAAGPATGTLTVAAATGGTVSATLTGTGSKGALSFSPSPIDLGTVAVGSSKTGQVVLKNNGTVPATSLAVTVAGGGFALDPATTCKAELAEGAECVVVFKFAPTAGGPLVGQINASAAGNLSAVAALSGTGAAAAALAISPPAATLLASAGAESAAFTFNVLNVGGSATGTLEAVLDGANATDFRIAATTCTSLAASATCTVQVVFKGATAVKTATLIVRDKAVATVTAQAALTGQPAPVTDLTVAGGPDLGTVNVGSTGTPVTFTVTNKAGAANSGALQVSVGSNEFIVSADLCTGKELAAAGTCTFAVALKPAAAGSKTTLLSVKGTTTTALVTLTGTATLAPVANAVIDPTLWDFGSVPTNMTSAAKTFTVTNKGAAATGALTFAVSGAQAAAFQATSTCNGPLAPAANCTVTVTFKPSVQGGLAAKVVVSDGTLSATADVSGTGVAPSMVKLSPTVVPVNGETCADAWVASEILSLDILGGPGHYETTCTPGGVAFPDTVVGENSTTDVTFTLTVVDTNLTSTGAITVATTGDAKDDYVVKANSCSVALSPSATCTITVGFSPKAVGPRNAQLQVTTENGGNAFAQLSAHAKAIVEIIPEGNAAITVTAPSVTPAVTGLNFGDQPVGSRGQQFVYAVAVRGSSVATDLNPVTVSLVDAAEPNDFNVISNNCSAKASTAVDYVCNIVVEFYPQTSKGVKTATLTVTGANGGTDTKTLTGNSTGPLYWTMTPADATISDIEVGDLSATALTLTLKNGGAVNQGPITLGALTGTNAAEFVVVTDGCTGEILTPSTGLNPSCTVEVKLLPTSVGAKTATVTATAGTETASFAVTGSSKVPTPITVSPNSESAAVSFGSVASEAKSDYVVFTVTNPAAAPTGNIHYELTAASTSFELAPAGERGSCGDSDGHVIPAGQNCTIKVRFAPKNAQGLGVKSGALKVSNAGSDEITVSLTGTATSQISVAPSTYDFGSVAAGSTSSSATFVVTNGGATAWSITAALQSVAEGFDLVSTTCNASILGGQSCNVVVQFAAPLTLVAKTTNLNLAAGSSSLSVVLKGTPVQPADIQAYGYASAGRSEAAPVAVPNLVALGTVAVQESTPDVTVTFKNVGAVASSALAWQWCDNADATTCDANGQNGEFVVRTEGSSCIGAQVASNATCTMVVHLTPSTSTTPAKSKYLNLKWTNGGSNTHVVGFQFTGTAIVTADASIVPANYTFPGPVAVSATTPPTQVFTIVNKSASPLALGAAAVNVVASGANAADFDVNLAGGSAPCSGKVVAGNLEANQSCTFVVTFNPKTTPGVVTRFATVGVSGQVSTGVSGAVVRPATLEITAPAASAGGSDFGKVATGQAGTAKTFVVKNVGDVATGALSVQMTGGNADLFTASGCAVSLAANETCDVSVNVTAAEVGAFASSLRVFSATVASADETAAVTGTSVYAATLTAPTTLTFATAQAVKSNSCYQPVTVSISSNPNTADTVPLTIGLASADNFELLLTTPEDAGSCTYVAPATGCAYYAAGNELNPAPSHGLLGNGTDYRCTIWVRFKPQTLPSPATLSTALSVAAGAAGTKSVAISGTATSALSLDAGSGAFGTASVNGTPVSHTFQVRNNAGAPETGILTTTVTGTGFWMAANDCVGKKLAPNGTCTVTVEFGPRAAGAATGQLAVSGTPGNGVTVDLTGTGQ